MRNPLASAFAFTLCGCLVSPVEFAEKSCDPEGRCATGYECVGDRCLTPEQIAQLECLPGETRDCGSDVGACRKGVSSCQADARFGPCLGETAPAQEVCDGVDNDCDGELDEDEGELCPLQQGVCQGARRLCVEGVLGECDASAYGPDFQPDETLCDGLDNDCDGEIDEGLDGDLDGYGPPGITCRLGTGDCDDDDPRINPGMEELCNGLDDDCDGRVDEGLDEDQDGHGLEGAAGCRHPGTDCDDTDPRVYPGATETCNGHDDDCDGEIDEDEGELCPLQQGVCQGARRLCAAGVLGQCEATAYGPDFQWDESRCDGLDNDCDGAVDENLDRDLDGYGPPGIRCGLGTGDCNDDNSQINPDMTELCNGKDDNCDGRVDEGLDEDQDGYGRPGAAGCRYTGIDCDDADPRINPGATELCNGLDDDCDGVIDDDTGFSVRVTLSTPGVTASNPALVGLASGGFLASWVEGDSLKFARLGPDGTILGSAVAASGIPAETTLLPAISPSRLAVFTSGVAYNPLSAAEITLGEAGLSASEPWMVTTLSTAPTSPALLDPRGTAAAWAGPAPSGPGTWTYADPLKGGGAAPAPEGVGPGIPRGFGPDERMTPARSALLLLDGSTAYLHTRNAGGTGYDPRVQLAGSVTHLAADGGAVAWIDGQKDFLYALRLDANRTARKLMNLPKNSSGPALARLGTRPAWTLAWMQPGSPRPVVAATRLDWIPGSANWTTGPVRLLGTGPADQLMVAADPVVAALGFRDPVAQEVRVLLYCR